VYVDTMKKKNKKNTAISPESVDDENDSDKEVNKKRKIPDVVPFGDRSFETCVLQP
jgi:hypothetical protein